MEERKDPPSTRCTFVITCARRELFHAGVPGDRVEIYEERDGKTTGRVLTARVLSVARFRMDELAP
jgi:hypothetical protein